VIVNKAPFDALDKATLYAVMNAPRDAETRGWKISEEKNDWYKKALTEKGMQIVTPSPQLVSDMRKIGATMLDDWLKKAGPDGKTVVDTFNKR
jgi:TRAP-type C4-dicarboxylate transport system substrate-binding protein